MTIYTAVMAKDGSRVAKIQDDGLSLYEYFTGYDFMGSANWSKDGDEALTMNLEEAEQIADDLTAGG